MADDQASDSLVVALGASAFGPDARPQLTNVPEGDLWAASIALSADKLVMVTCVEDSGFHSGEAVYTWDWVDPNWVQRAHVIDPDDIQLNFDYTDGFQFGSAVALSSDGTILAVGCHFYSTDGALYNNGGVFIFDYNGGTGRWDVRGSGDPDVAGTVIEDRLGMGVALSDDGTVLMAMGLETLVDWEGFIDTWDWVDPNWVIRSGDRIEGPTKNPDYFYFGMSLSCSGDGDSLVLVTHKDAGGPSYSVVRCYEWSGSAWSLKGAEIEPPDGVDGPGEGEYFSATMPDTAGDIIVLRYHDESASLAPDYSTELHVYDWVDPNWVKRAASLTEPSVPTFAFYFGRKDGLWASPNLDYVATREMVDGVLTLRTWGFAAGGKPCITKTSLGQDVVIVDYLCTEVIYPSVAQDPTPPNIPQPPYVPPSTPSDPADCDGPDYFDYLKWAATEISDNPDYLEWVLANWPEIDPTTGVCT